MLLRKCSKSGIDCRPLRSTLLSSLIATIACYDPSAAMLLAGRPQSHQFNWSNELATRFDTVGQIQCHDPANPGVAKTATGWIVGSADTVVTAAHLFFQRSRAGGRDADILSPNRCTFILYDGQGALRDVIGFRYGLSEWVDGRHRYDGSYDVAVLKLDRRASVRSIPAVKIVSHISTPMVKLAAFHGGPLRQEHPWLTSGRTQPFPASIMVDHFDDMRISDTRRMLAASADSTPGSSGGMYFDPAQNAAIGIHVGSLCAEGRTRHDPTSCFNYGLRFDAKILKMIDSVATDNPPMAQVIIPDGNS
ncbi:serine protease [Rhizorhabdus sp.]|uniref:trypsin-like serine peptidase n=1 Tax=Rhizorhabdus sp. TaxID=1968843 RepID=UPI0025ECCFA4|nr:serine protease [Rhizorhabdus sp.]